MNVFISDARSLETTTKERQEKQYIQRDNEELDMGLI